MPEYVSSGSLIGKSEVSDLIPLEVIFFSAGNFSSFQREPDVGNIGNFV